MFLQTDISTFLNLIVTLHYCHTVCIREFYSFICCRLEPLLVRSYLQLY